MSDTIAAFLRQMNNQKVSLCPHCAHYIPVRYRKFVRHGGINIDCPGTGERAVSAIMTREQSEKLERKNRVKKTRRKK